MKGRPVRTRDDREAAREPGKRAFPLRLEQPIAAKRFERPLERLAAQAIARLFDRRHAQLHVAAHGVHGHLPVHDNGHAVFEDRPDPPLVVGPHDASQLRRPVAKREVPVPVPVGLEVNDLSPNPQRMDRALDDVADRLANEFLKARVAA